MDSKMRTTNIVQKQSQNKVQNTCSDQMRGHLCVASFGKILLEWSEGSGSQTSKLHPFVTPILGKIFWGRLWKKRHLPCLLLGFLWTCEKIFFVPFFQGLCVPVSPEQRHQFCRWLRHFFRPRVYGIWTEHTHLQGGRVRWACKSSS